MTEKMRKVTVKVRAIIRRHERRDYRGYHNWDGLMKEATEAIENPPLETIRFFQKGGKKVSFRDVRRITPK